MNDLAIGIVNWNTRELLISCLTRLAVAEPDAAVWVLDNGSADGSACAVREAFPQVHLLESPFNLGFAGGVNRLLCECDAEYLVLLNTDAIPDPGALSRLRDYAAAHPEVAAVGPLLVDGEGRAAGCHDRFPAFWQELANVLGWRRLPHHRQADADVDWIGGACMLLRARAVAEVGVFDTSYFMYCEETDWCYRAHRRGWRIACVPSARVVHLVGLSGGVRRRAQLAESKIRFNGRYHSSRQARILAAMLTALNAVAWLGSVTRRGLRSREAKSYASALRATSFALINLPR
jgi:N-acetylglucosaminyl-diphospho-decaprenol L-rhamnosyltransferase